MKIGNRNYLILKEILERSAVITGKELERKYSLSRKQLEYGLKKINEYLADNEFGQIRRTAGGRFIVPGDVLTGIDLQALQEENEDIWFSKEERLLLILLMLFTDEKGLSLQHFITELKVSKNTVLADLKKLDEKLEISGLEVEYNRKNGYTLNGPELAEREILFTALHSLLSEYHQRAVVRNIGHIRIPELKDIQNWLEEIEGKLGTEFTDEMVQVYSCFLLILFRRIRDGHILTDVPKVFQHVLWTEEYEVLHEALKKQDISDKNEIMYLTARIQGMKVNKNFLEETGNRQNVRQAVDRTIDEFERRACILFVDRKELSDSLTSHCEPALYRIQYDFNIGSDITEYVLPAYQELYNIVEESVEPLEELIHKKIPAKELVYITLIFGTQMNKEGMLNDESSRLNAIVVCQNGITVSRYLWTSLKQMFPDIRFIQCMSVRQFRSYSGVYDLVFSTVPLETTKRQFVIQPLMDEKQKKTLKEKVTGSMMIGSTAAFQLDAIMRIVKKHIKMQSYEDLKLEIETCLGKEKGSGAGTRSGRVYSPQLKELLPESHIQIVQSSIGWREALKLASLPLLADKSIEYEYVNAMFENIEKNKPFLTVAEDVIIAHAGAGRGVYAVGMTVTVLPEITEVSDYLSAKVIIVLATPDYESHLIALDQLIQLLEAPEKLAVLKNASSEEEILKIL